jgi:hypothetical protein
MLKLLTISTSNWYVFSSFSREERIRWIRKENDSVDGRIAYAYPHFPSTKQWKNCLVRPPSLFPYTLLSFPFWPVLMDQLTTIMKISWLDLQNEFLYRWGFQCRQKQSWHRPVIFVRWARDSSMAMWALTRFSHLKCTHFICVISVKHKRKKCVSSMKRTYT